MDYDELLERSKSSKIEKALLNALYPELGPNGKKDIQAQYMIDYPDMLVTLPDFAFPSLQIAIYCDGYEFHQSRKRFKEDRQQSRELQLRGWCVLRFAGREILYEKDVVVRTIERAIRRENQQKRPTLDYFDEISTTTPPVVRTIERAIRRENQQKRPTLDYFDEISTTTPPVVRTIEQAVRRRSWRDIFSIGGAFAAGLVAAVVLMILIESLFPTLFYYLTAGF